MFAFGWYSQTSTITTQVQTNSAAKNEDIFGTKCRGMLTKIIGGLLEIVLTW